MSTEKSIEQILAEKAIQDPAFKAALKANPKAALAKELGTELPADLQVEVVETSETKFYVVLPSDSLLSGDEELSDEQLEAVAGGIRIKCFFGSNIGGGKAICTLWSAVRSRR